MRSVSTLAIGVLAAICSASAAHADPLAQARAGMVQCFEPDVARKTCSMISSFTFAKNHEISNIAEIMLSSNPLIVAKSDSPVEVRGAAVCGPLRKKDIDDATILIGGWPASPEKAAPIKAQLETGAKPFFGKESCSTYQPKGNMFIERPKLNGKLQPDLVKQFIWVRADAGYSVAP